MIVFRLASAVDTDAIERIYDAVHEAEEAGKLTIGWVRDVYPTRATAEEGICAGDMYVAEDNGCIVASARINRIQMPEYADVAWEHAAGPREVLVLHTLVVMPGCGGRGLGSRFVGFYEQLAREKHCPCLRMDTHVINVAARRLYAKLGYREVGIVPCSFNGIQDVRLVCLEKHLDEKCDYPSGLTA